MSKAWLPGWSWTAPACAAVVTLVVSTSCGDDDTDSDDGEGDSLAGTYVCVHPGGGSDELVLEEDGKLTITPQEGPRAGEAAVGTWTREGNTVTFSISGETESLELENGSLSVGDSDCSRSS